MFPLSPHQLGQIWKRIGKNKKPTLIQQLVFDKQYKGARKMNITFYLVKKKILEVSKNGTLHSPNNVYH
jgi:hypothetical protein